MDRLRWQRLELLFERASELPPGDRTAFLDGVFAGEEDSGLRAELEEMLQDDGNSSAPDGGAIVAGAIAGGLELWASGEPPPGRLGPYRILREIGRGGMATVYEAERDDREFERRVAVKVLRRGMDSDDIVRRLRRERQILANLDHPHIARLLDGGTTGDGRPFVVMEHIDGLPIDLYCQSRALGLEARLRLFRHICDAVHFAHKNLVLHRDIKPSNILVTAEGQPKLLDFGIAKLLESGGDSEIQPTRTGLRLLTPEWASPEQIRGEPLTTGSDVYSLGLLLYMLVAGRRAYRVEAKSPAELERIVCRYEPPPPSLAAGKETAAPRWRRLANALAAPSGDLDVVVLAALHKDPARRYASAEQLGEDVRRVLEKLPIAARRDTFGYRGRIFARRHRLALSLAALTFAALLTTALVAVGQARMARAESRRAEENLRLAEAQRQRAEQVASFLADIFKVSDPGEARGRTLTAREVLDQGAARLRHSLAGDPELRADLLGTIGRVYQSLALYDDAQGLLEEALELHRAREPRGAATAAGLRQLAQLALDRGQYERAAPLAREAHDIFAGAEPPQPLEIARCLQQLAELEADFDRFAAAEELYQRSLAISEKLLGADAEEVSFTRNSLGELLYQRGAHDEAKAIFEEVLATRRRVSGEDHPEVLTSLNNLAAAELALRRPAAAERHLREVLAIRRRIFGENHGDVAVALHNLATVLAERGDPAGAIENMEAALRINRRVLGENNGKVADSLHNLAIFHQSVGHQERAEALYEEALALRRKIYGASHPAVAQTLRNLGDLSIERRPGRAEACFREALEIDRRALPAGDHRLAQSLAGLGRLELARRRFTEAEALFRQALEILRRGRPDDWRRAELEGWLGRTLDLRRRGDPAAASLLAGCVAELEKKLGAEHPRTRQMAAFLADARRPAS